MGLVDLISYNYHVTENEGDAEEIWLSGALGRLVADLTGFGAISHSGVWEYLDAPNNKTMSNVEVEEGELTSNVFYGQYLFVRWLYDAYGAATIASLMNSETTGVDNIESATGETFEALLIKWQMALMSSHSNPSQEGIDINTTDFPPLSHPQVITAPTVGMTPASGDYYGANGYQTGIDIYGENISVKDGTTSNPEVIDTLLFESLDHYKFCIWSGSLDLLKVAILPKLYDL